MVNCSICGKVNSRFGYLEDRLVRFCLIHKKEDMYDLINKLCEYVNPDTNIHCKNRANFGAWHNKYTHCKTCMVKLNLDLTYSRTTKCGYIDTETNEACKKQPIFGYEIGKPVRCKDHIDAGMFDVKNKKCCVQYDENGMIKICDVRKTYGFEKNKPLRCKNHIEEGMCDVTHDFCEQEECKIRSNYGHGKQSTHCSKHGKLLGMKNIVSYRCINNNCNLIASFGYKNTTKALYCSKHQTPGMINVRHKKCKLCEFIQANPKYDKYCSRCYFHEHPDDKRVINYKIKELEFTKRLKEEYPNAILDKTIKGGNSKRRPDFLLELDGYYIIVEIDENQHVKYDETCENRRIVGLYIDVNHENIDGDNIDDIKLVIIRLNPDKYVTNGVITKGCFEKRKDRNELITRKNEFAIRFETLKSVVGGHVSKQPAKAITLINLFMDIE